MMLKTLLRITMIEDDTLLFVWPFRFDFAVKTIDLNYLSIAVDVVRKKHLINKQQPNYFKRGRKLTMINFN